MREKTELLVFFTLKWGEREYKENYGEVQFLSSLFKKKRKRGVNGGKNAAQSV